MTKLIDISDILTDKAFKELKKGQVLRFQMEGSPTDLKIVRLNRRLKKCFAEEITLYRPEDISVIERDSNE